MRDTLLFNAVVPVKFIFPHPLDPLFPWLRRKVNPKREAALRAEAVEVERWSGACLMIRRDAVAQVERLFAV